MNGRRDGYRNGRRDRSVSPTRRSPGYDYRGESRREIAERERREAEERFRQQEEKDRRRIEKMEMREREFEQEQANLRRLREDLDEQYAQLGEMEENLSLWRRANIKVPFKMWMTNEYKTDRQNARMRQRGGAEYRRMREREERGRRSPSPRGERYER